MQDVNATKPPSLGQLLLSWRRLVYYVCGTAAVVAIAVSLLLPNWYSGVATCMPPAEGQSRGSVLSFISQMGVDFGGAGLLSATPATDVQLGVLKSRNLRSQVVDRHDLVEAYNAKSREHAIRELSFRLSVNTTPEGLIQVRVEDKDRQRAADMANSFVEFLDDYNRATSIDDAARTIEFIESTLDSNQARLQTAARDLKAFQRRHGAIEITEQTRATVETIAQLEFQKAELEIQKGVLARYAMPDNQQLRELNLRIREIERMIERMEGGGAAESDTSSLQVLLPLAEIPDLAFRFAELTREVMVQERVYEFLSSQLEDARIRLSKDMQVIQVLDEAVPPIKKSRPRRSLICILSVLLSLFATVTLIVLVDMFTRHAARSDSLSREESSILKLCNSLRRWAGPESTSQRKNRAR